MKNILIIGINSQIGSLLFQTLKDKNINVFGTTRNKEQLSSNILFFDLSNPKFSIDFSKFDSVVICAGLGIKKCASNPKESEQINVKNTIQLIDHCSKYKCFIVFLSSIKVFIGSEQFYDVDAKQTPDSNYARYKVAVEEYLKKINISACVLRITKVITDKTDFIGWWDKELNECKEIIVYTNHFLSPVPTKDVVDAIVLLVNKKSPGLFHIGSNETISYYEYAKKIFANNDKALSLLKPLTDTSPIYNSLKTRLPI